MAPTTTSGRPYFFFSYAHLPAADGITDPNIWVGKLFHTVREHVISLIHVSPDEAGYMDRESMIGDYWPEQASKNLSTCRVFVPLYSRGYFESEYCGKEWAAFLGRAQGYGVPRAIVPALWVPPGQLTLPAAAADIQFNHADINARYADEGFYGIIKLSKYRRQFEEAAFALAKQIIEIAEKAPMPERAIPDYRSVPSAFDHSRPDRPVTVTVVAPDQGSLPRGREPYHYGRSPREWDPYRDHNGSRPLADCAAEVARARGFRPMVGSLEDHLDGLCAEEPQAPGVMLVDPWATTQAQWRDSLHRVDQPGRRWITVIVPWNRDDQQLMRDETRLRGCLEDALGTKLGEPASEPEVPTLDAFRLALPEVLNKASQQFFKYAPAYPPEGEKVEKPRLMGPEESV
ncbi:TIR domain-containing protein [Streptosporangiaceae bacterium NEAU-GS5]|nr:TIR domain-containing protein [Streptosporangiaceae bacterium NEAU-GS5]